MNVTLKDMLLHMTTDDQEIEVSFEGAGYVKGDSATLYCVIREQIQGGTVLSVEAEEDTLKLIVKCEEGTR